MQRLENAQIRNLEALNHVVCVVWQNEELNEHAGLNEELNEHVTTDTYHIAQVQPLPHEHQCLSQSKHF